MYKYVMTWMKFFKKANFLTGVQKEIDCWKIMLVDYDITIKDYRVFHKEWYYACYFSG